jgi:hypothetical protein
LKASNAISSRQARTAGPRGKTASSSSTDRHFILDGPSRPVDVRIDAWRKDLADISLAGRVFAPHYARPLPRACGAHATPLRPSPSADSEAASELLPGEEYDVLEYAGGWAWGFSSADHLVGYVESIALADPVEATHIVREKYAPVAADASVTAAIIATLPMGSRLHGKECGACLTTEYGCVSLSHLCRVGELEADPAVVAERLLGAPYRAGGRSAAGVDAAGLVQLSLALCGIAAPRLPDQLATLGTPVPKGAPARRGDLVLLDPGSGSGQPGAGLMIDDLLMIHASTSAGKVCVEPISLYETQRRRLPL